MQLPVLNGAVFDLDGTLLDSMYVWSDVNRDFLKKRGLTAPDGYIEKIAPMFSDEAADYAIRTLGLSDEPEDLLREWDEMALCVYAGKVTLKNGAGEYLRKLKDSGVKLGVATALTSRLYRPVLEHNGSIRLIRRVRLLLRGAAQQSVSGCLSAGGAAHRRKSGGMHGI